MNSDNIGDMLDVGDFEHYDDGAMRGGAEASTLGLPPGVWPDDFTAIGYTFLLDRVLRDGSHRYRVPHTKITFTIFND
jgi:hypothetical protein